MGLDGKIIEILKTSLEDTPEYWDALRDRRRYLDTLGPGREIPGTLIECITEAQTLRTEILSGHPGLEVDIRVFPKESEDLGYSVFLGKGTCLPDPGLPAREGAEFLVDHYHWLGASWSDLSRATWLWQVEIGRPSEPLMYSMGKEDKPELINKKYYYKHE